MHSLDPRLPPGFSTPRLWLLSQPTQSDPVLPLMFPIFYGPFCPSFGVRTLQSRVYAYPVSPDSLSTWARHPFPPAQIVTIRSSVTSIQSHPKPEKEKKIEEIPLESPLYYNNALHELVKGKSKEEIQEALKAHSLISREFDFLGKQALLITYPHESLNFSPVGRASRGTVLVLEQGEWKVLRAMLPRMKETNASWALKKEAEACQKVEEKLVSSSLETSGVGKSWMASDKADGMLVTATMIDKETLREQLQVLSSTGKRADDILLPFLRLADRLNLRYVPVLGTQKSFPLSDHGTIDYVMMSLICSTAGISEEEFKFFLEENGSMASVIDTYGETFLRGINCVADGLKPQFSGEEPITLSFEAICRDRKDSSGKLHNELAVSYDSSSFVILAASQSSKDGIATVPHYRFSSLVKNAGLTEPRWWHFVDETCFNQFLSAMYQVTVGALSEAQFNQTYPSLGNSVKSHKFPAEGVIVYKPGDVYGSKMKNELYYLSHGLSRLKIDEVGRVLNAGSKTSYFPDASKFFRLFENISDRLERALRTCLSVIDDEYKPAQQDLPENDQKACIACYGYNTFAEYLFSSVKDKEILNLQDKSLRFKRLSIFFSSDLSVKFIWRVFQTEFPEIGYDKLISVKDKSTDQMKERFPAAFKQLIESFGWVLKRGLTPIEFIEKARNSLKGTDLSEKIDVNNKNPQAEAQALFAFLMYLFQIEKPVNKVSIVDVFPFGNMEGRDLDVAVQVAGSINGELDLEEVKKRLASKGFVTNKKIDITLFARNGKGSIIISSKGSCQMMEWILYETAYTQSSVEVPPVPDVATFTTVLGKYLSTNFKVICGPIVYEKLYGEKEAAWENGTWGLVDFAIKSRHHIVRMEDDKLKQLYNLTAEDSEKFAEIKEKHLSAIKGLTMKLVQLHLSHAGQFTTITERMIDRMVSLFPEFGSKDNYLYLFTRGEKGDYNPQTLPRLLQGFVDHAQRVMPKAIDFKTLSISLADLNPSKYLEMSSSTHSNKSDLYDQLIAEFLKNPNWKKTDHKEIGSELPGFMKCLETLTHQDRSLNQSFQLKSLNTHLLPQSFQFETVAQRSYQWKERYSFYDCGVLAETQSHELKELEDSTADHFHLIRGAIGEVIALNALENLIQKPTDEFKSLVPGYKLDALVTVGLIVTKINQKGSKGIAPDGLIKLTPINGHMSKWMPIEIKVYGKSKPSLRDLSRERGLAIKQLRSALSFFPKESSIEKGLLVELYCNDFGSTEAFTLKASIVDFSPTNDLA